MNRRASLQPRFDPGTKTLTHTMAGTTTTLEVPAYGGWKWATADGAEYHTDDEGHGLWFNTGCNWTQVKGTCDFYLPQDRAKTLRILRRLGYTPI